MKSHSRSFNCANFVQAMEGKTNRKVFINIMKGIHSATITLKHFSYGEPANGNTYRKYFYNKYGQVIKKFYFDDQGELDMKEVYDFDKDGKILHSQFITVSSYLTEDFIYDKKGLLQEYFLRNPKWALEDKGKHDKKEKYTFDRKNRKIKKVSYGRLGTPELITHYIYKGNQDKYKYRHVTYPNGSLIITLLYTYDKNNNQIGLHSFMLPPDEVEQLIKKNKDWEMVSNSSSHWEYDKYGNAISFTRDEPAKPFHIQYQQIEYGTPKNGRVVTQKSTSEFKKSGRKFYLVKTTKWWPKFDEPMKLVEEFNYYRANGDPIKLS